jgi:YesN/AraC family two-component response regulator
MDLTVPGGLGGKEAIKKLQEIDPEVKAIVSSAYSTDPVMANFREYGFSDFITKPYQSMELSKVLHKVIAGS